MILTGLETGVCALSPSGVPGAEPPVQKGDMRGKAPPPMIKDRYLLRTVLKGKIS